MAVTAEDVLEIRFTPASLGAKGYHEIEVDAFLHRVAQTLEGEDRLTADDVHRVAFGRAPLGKRGYDRAAVDAFLRQVESTLAARADFARAYIAPALEDSHGRKSIWRRLRSNA
ncbi:cell division protein DivIVA [Amycolatopsis antarctica]|uniref:Cell wall synthesis protein Wag31 n=1 Tax=Amycolatopsis antarctica TaxID=1854586 RepID=A0A263D7R4_9PSEU|nr:DivIVA domain-containing protein [Amycolatopsis antarctica]OZM73526.1 cell division protein DivIVA [Amycolatopsis antarctica]